MTPEEAHRLLDDLLIAARELNDDSNGIRVEYIFGKARAKVLAAMTAPCPVCAERERKLSSKECGMCRHYSHIQRRCKVSQHHRCPDNLLICKRWEVDP